MYFLTHTKNSPIIISFKSSLFLCLLPRMQPTRGNCGGRDFHFQRIAIPIETRSPSWMMMRMVNGDAVTFSYSNDPSKQFCFRIPLPPTITNEALNIYVHVWIWLGILRIYSVLRTNERTEETSLRWMGRTRRSMATGEGTGGWKAGRPKRGVRGWNCFTTKPSMSNDCENSGSKIMYYVSCWFVGWWWVGLCSCAQKEIY